MALQNIRTIFSSSSIVKDDALFVAYDILKLATSAFKTGPNNKTPLSNTEVDEIDFVRKVVRILS